jgi:DNA-binding transcriptional LysR family regulator
MDPRCLRTFAAVARLTSFSAAARELGYTQSAVSQHVAALEADVGSALLTRRPVALTPAGARLLEHADAILLRLEAARADVRRAAAGASSALRVGATPLASERAAALVAAARDERPALAVSVVIAAREAVATAVATGELDAGLVDGVAAVNDPLRLPEAGVPVAEAHEEPLAVALWPGHPLLRREPLAAAGVRLEDLADARWIDAPQISAPLGELASLARTDGFRAALHYGGLDVRGLLALVATGQGLALLPARALAGLDGLPLRSPPLVHRTELLRAGG